MSSTIVNIREYNAPANQHDVLNNIRLAAIDFGWTIDEWRTSESWDWWTAQWIAGDDQFLQMHHHPNGQTWHYRFGSKDMENDWHVYDGGYNYRDQNWPDPRTTHYDGYIWCGIQDSAHASYVSGGARYHPIEQDSLLPNWDNWRYRMFSVSNAPMIKQWIFGNDKFIHCVIDMDGYYCQHITFGIPDFIDAADATTFGPYHTFTSVHGGIATWDKYLTIRSVASWYNCDRTNMPFPSSFLATGEPLHTPNSLVFMAGNWYPGMADVWWRGGNNADTYGGGRPYNYSDSFGYEWCQQYNADSRSTSAVATIRWVGPLGPRYDKLLYSPCTMTGQRVMIRDTWYAAHAADRPSGNRDVQKCTWRPYAKTHWHYVNCNDLTIGQTLSHGAEDFIIFPLFSDRDTEGDNMVNMQPINTYNSGYIPFGRGRHIGVAFRTA